MSKRKALRINSYDMQNINIGIPNNSVASILGGATDIHVGDIVTDEPFKSLFAINSELLTQIVCSMKEKGYDTNHPIIIWKEKGVLIDGHTRVQAAKLAGISHIPAFYASFADEDAVMDYMLSVQFNRRNITDAELINLLARVMDKYNKKYGEGSRSQFLKKQFMGLSESKAKKAVVVLDKANKRMLKKIQNGSMSISYAYGQLKKNREELSKKVPANYFSDDSTEPTRVDDNGIFYLRHFESKKEYKAFKLPAYWNTEEIRAGIQEVIRKATQIVPEN